MSRSPLLPILLTVFVDVLGLTLMLPLLPFYAEHFGASPLTVTILGASYAACQLVSGPLLGRLSDRIGRKPVLLGSQIGTLLGFLLIASASWADPRYGLLLLFAGRMIDGATAGNLSIAQAYISDVTTTENRTRSFALIGIAFGMGFLFGPPFSGLLAHSFGFASPAFAAAALSMLSIFFTARFLPNQVELEKLKLAHGAAPEPGGPPAGARTFAFGRFLSRPATRAHLLQFFAFTTSFAVLTGGLALFLERRFGFNVKSTGYVFMVSGLVGALIQGGAIGRLVKRFGEAKLALLGFLSMALTFPFLGVVGHVGELIAIVAISSFGVAVVRPCVTTLITRSVNRGEQGAALGTGQSLASIAQLVGQPLAGLLIEHKLLGGYGLAAGAFALVGVLLSLQVQAPVAPVPSS